MSKALGVSTCDATVSFHQNSKRCKHVVYIPYMSHKCSHVVHHSYMISLSLFLSVYLRSYNVRGFSSLFSLRAVRRCNRLMLQSWNFRREREQHINSFPNFTVPVEDNDGTEFTIHFVALFSETEDAISLAFFHGWPGVYRPLGRYYQQENLMCRQAVSLNFSAFCLCSRSDIHPLNSLTTLLYLLYPAMPSHLVLHQTRT